MIKKLIEKRINSFVEKVLSERKVEINTRITKELELYEEERKKILSEKREQLKSLDIELESGITDKNNLILKINEEKSRLSDTLNIVNQNLTAHDIWMKLWTVAFDKAMDVCWDLQKDNAKKLVSLVKDDTSRELQLKTQEIIDNHNKNVEKQLENMDLNKMSILNAHNEAHKNYLIYNKTGDRTREAFYNGQLELIRRILNEKKA